ncbi:MAG TPA: hypothetical protein VF384_14875 [Planctomycetota bacterium]
MRTGKAIVLAAVLWSGCVSTQDAVPLPATTPFERSSREEAEYLRLFRSGYLSGRRGYLSTCCLLGDDFDDPVKVARSQGWSAGQDEGYLVWVAEVERAIAAQDRRRLLVLFEALGEDAGAAVEDSLADKHPRVHR